MHFTVKCLDTGEVQQFSDLDNYITSVSYACLTHVSQCFPSLKEREREVQMSRSAQEKEWGRERDHLRKSEAIDDYKSFLVDMVRSANASWYDTKRLLRNDSRWRMFETLDIDEKEGLFREHVSNLSEKKRLWFRKLLEETSQVCRNAIILCTLLYFWTMHF